MVCNCTTTHGLMILPVNYWINPIEHQLPEWAKQPAFTQTDLNYQYSYDLRVLRKGFVYLFYEKGERGVNYWEVYSVSENGSLWKQGNVGFAREENNTGCMPSLGMPAKAEFICIESPQQCGKVWLAFSEKKWPQDVTDAYAKNTAQRVQRMTVINPSEMYQNQFTGLGATTLTSSSLAEVIDYRENLQFNSIIADPTFRGQGKLVKDEIANWNSDFLSKHKTAYPWQLSRQIEQTEKAAALRSANGAASYIVCLSDAVGIAYELNGWSNEVVGNFELFTQERDHECQSDALQSIFAESVIDFEKEHFAANLAVNESLHREITNPWLDKVRKNEGSNWLQQRRAIYQSDFVDNQDMVSALMAGCDLWQQWSIMTDISSSYYQRLDTVMYNAQHEHDAGKLRKKIAGLKHKSEMTASIAQDSHVTDKAQIPERAKAEYKKYDDMINHQERALFHQKYQAILDDVKVLHEQRSENLFAWLRGSAYLNTLNDFSPDNLEEGILFERLIVNSLWGSHDSKIGSDVIGDWINSYDVPHTNLIWRALAFNQTAAVDDLKQFLSTINWDEVIHSDDGLAKFINTISDRLSTLTEVGKGINENLSQPLAATASTFGKNMRKADKLAAIFISKFSDYMPAVVDNLNKVADNTRYIVAQRVLLARAGIEPDVVKAIYQENYLEKSWRQRIKDLIRKYNIDPIFSQRAHVNGIAGEEARRYFDNLNRTNLKILLRGYKGLSDKQVMQKKLGILIEEHNNTQLSSITESRFSAILLLFQLPVICNLLTNTDKKSAGELALQWFGVASTTISLLSDIIIRPMELSYGSAANRVLTVRYIGGFATLGASLFGLVYNISQSFNDDNRKVDYAIYGVYVAIFTAQSITALNALSQLFKKYIAEHILEKLTALVATRLVTIFGSWIAQIVMLGADVIWSHFQKDDTQKWIIKTRFGLEFDKKMYPNFAAELEKFKEIVSAEDDDEHFIQATSELLTRMGVPDYNVLRSSSLLDYFNVEQETPQSAQPSIIVPFKA